MKQNDLIVKSYKDHGYKQIKRDDDILEFETDYDYNMKHNKHKDHPIYESEDQKEQGSKILLHLPQCYCGGLVEEGVCVKCGKKHRVATEKGHIKYPSEEQQGNKVG